MLPYVILRVFCDWRVVTAKSGVEKKKKNVFQVPASGPGQCCTSLLMEESLFLSSQHCEKKKLLVRSFSGRQYWEELEYSWTVKQSTIYSRYILLNTISFEIAPTALMRFQRRFHFSRHSTCDFEKRKSASAAILFFILFPVLVQTGVLLN